MNGGKEHLIKQLQLERRSFESVLESLTEEQIINLEVSDYWTVKDTIAHITAWEFELLRWLERASEGLSPDVPGPGEWMPFIETFNSSTYLANRERPLEDVLSEFDQVYKQILTELQSLPEDPDDDYWTVWFNEEPPWILLATYHRHYKEHSEQISARIAGTV
jgi:hypothetical protein